MQKLLFNFFALCYNKIVRRSQKEKISVYLKFQNDVREQHNIFAAVQNDLFPLLSLSVMGVGEFRCGKNYLTEREGYNCYLMLFTLSGQGKLVYRGKTFTVKPDTVMLIDCNEWQKYCTDGNEWNFRFVHFSGTAAAYLYENITAGDRFIIPVRDTVTFRAALNELFSAPRIVLPQEFLKCSAALGEAFALLLNEQNSAENRVRPRARILRAKEIIEKNYAKPVSLDELAAECFLSKFYFVRLFRLHTGFSPGAYLRSFRITQAQNLLKSTDNGIEEIAEQVGYTDVSAFIRAFRQVTGLTPNQFRNL